MTQGNRLISFNPKFFSFPLSPFHLCDMNTHNIRIPSPMLVLLQLASVSNSFLHTNIIFFMGALFKNSTYQRLRYCGNKKGSQCAYGLSCIVNIKCRNNSQMYTTYKQRKLRLSIIIVVNTLMMCSIEKEKHPKIVFLLIQTYCYYLVHCCSQSVNT